MSTSGMSNSITPALEGQLTLSAASPAETRQLTQSPQTTGPPAAQQDSVTLSPQARDLTTSSLLNPAEEPSTNLFKGIATYTSAQSAFQSVLSQLREHLLRGDLSAVQNDLSSLGAALRELSTATEFPSLEPVAANSNQLILAFLQAISAGNDKAATTLGHLANIATSAQGAGILNELTQGHDQNVLTASTSNAVAHLLQSNRYGSGDATTSLLKLLS